MNWGIYASGAIAKAFAHDMQKLNSEKIIAVYARDEDKGRRLCQTFKIERYYNDEREFFLDNDIDVVYIATPHSLHADVTIKSLKAGKHVLCEKPFAINAHEARRVFSVAKEEHRFVMDALWTLFLPVIHKVFEWIENDKIGAIKVIQANFGFKGNNDPQGRLHNLKLGGGALLDVGVYPVLMANRLAQSAPKTIHAYANFTSTGVDGSTFMSLVYPNKIQAVLKASIETQLINDLVIYGSKGKIVVPLFWMANEAICFCESEILTFVSDESQKSGHHYEAMAVATAISEGRLEHESVSHQFTLELMETLDRIRAKIGLVYPQDNIQCSNDDV